MTNSKAWPNYEHRKIRLLKYFSDGARDVRQKKRSISNRFQYKPGTGRRSKGVELGNFNHVLDIDLESKTLHVEGLTTYERIVDYTLPHGLLPTVTPELKYIAVGGAIKVVVN